MAVRGEHKGLLCAIMNKIGLYNFLFDYLFYELTIIECKIVLNEQLHTKNYLTQQPHFVLRVRRHLFYFPKQS